MALSKVVDDAEEDAQVCQDGLCGVVITTGSLLVSWVKGAYKSSPQFNF